jgi:hypothetical protein
MILQVRRIPTVQIEPGGAIVKKARLAAPVVLFLLIFASPSISRAQSWWEGFANAPQSNAFWSWLQMHPSISQPLMQNPYQVYNPSWRAQHPEFQQYINDNPSWWNSVRGQGSRYYGERFNRFLKNHPGIARDLQNNPDLIFDANYRAQHPDLNQFLKGHPNIWTSIKNQRYAYSANGGWGAYDNQGRWRNEPWWKENGDWDQQRKWHDRDWWMNNNRQWAEKHHPGWFNKPGNMPPGQMKKMYKHGHGDHDRD